MKNIKSILFLGVILFSCLTTTLFAQNRQSKDVPNLVKNVSRTKAFEFSSFGFGWKDVPYEFVSLKDIDNSRLTDTEKKLLNIFSDVAFCFKGSKVHACYWVKNEEGYLGLIKFDGNVLVPPVKGNILQGTHPDRIIIGEQSVNPNSWLEEYHSRVTTFSGRGLGHFAAVVDDVKDEKKIHASIPAGKYDDIMLGIKGTNTYYFVARIIDGEMKWGVVDKNDKEVMAIEAKGIYKKKGAASWLYGNVGGKWVASETMDMSQIENMVINEENMARQRKEQLAAFMSTLGGVLMSTAVTIEQAKQIKNGNNVAVASSSYSESSVNTGGSLETQYRQWENRAKANYNSLTNLGTRKKKNGKDDGGTTGQGMSSSNYVSMQKALREAQKQMKDIREKASKKGIKINKSEYEDIVVKY